MGKWKYGNFTFHARKNTILSIVLPEHNEQVFYFRNLTLTIPHKYQNATRFTILNAALFDLFIMIGLCLLFSSTSFGCQRMRRFVFSTPKTKKKLRHRKWLLFRIITSSGPEIKLNVLRQNHSYALAMFTVTFFALWTVLYRRIELTKERKNRPKTVNFKWSS